MPCKPNYAAGVNLIMPPVRAHPRALVTLRQEISCECARVPPLPFRLRHNLANILQRRSPLSTVPDNDKEGALRRHHALNPRPEGVSDPTFRSGDPFFDPWDLVQVKYEMLRRARAEGSTVSGAAAAFGFSRPSFYESKAAYESDGLPGLLPKRPGPRRAHKLSGAVVERLEEALAAEPSLSSADLAELARAEFDLSVHPRSIERAMARRPKDGKEPRP